MRILMLTQFYPPIIGGEERHVRNLSLELATRGHDVTVVTLRQGATPAFEYSEGVRIYRIRALMQSLSFLFSEQERQHAPPFPDPGVLLALRSIIQREQPDIIHAHNWIVHSFTPLKKWSKAKLVVTLHDYSLLCETKRLLYRGEVCSGPALARCLQCSCTHYGLTKGIVSTGANKLFEHVERQAVDMFLPVSHAVAQYTRLPQHTTPYRVVHNFVPDAIEERYDDTYPYLKDLPTGNFLLCVGDLVQDKGIDVLLRAYRQLERPIPLVLIGRKGKDLTEDFPQDTYMFESWPHTAIMSAWKRCTIALVPSIGPDACPTVAMEAMAMGKPVIASKIGGLLDIQVDGETGYLVTPRDHMALRTAIQVLIDHPEQREQMGQMALQRVLKFKAMHVVSQIEQVYEEVLLRSEHNSEMCLVEK